MLPLGVHQDLVGFLLGFENRFLLAGFRIPLRVLDDAERLFFGPADGFSGNAPAVGDPDGKNGGGHHRRDDGRYDQIDQ